MRASIAVVVALVLLAAIPGCAPAPGMPPPPTAGLGSELDRLRDADGVRAADLDAGDGRASLVVDLEDELEDAALATIGAHVDALIAEADDRGEGIDAVLRLDRSVYSYFEGIHDGELQAQLGYWLGLVRAGPEAVTMLNFAPGQAPAAGLPSATGEPVFRPRYVLIDLPGDLDRADRAAIIDRLSSVPDPGADGGQWDVLDLAPETKGEYAGGAFPARADLRLDADLGELFAGTPGLAGLQVHRSAELTPALRLQLVLFDPDMDEIAAAAAEEEFAGTDGFMRLVDAVGLLERRPADYRFTVLSSPLREGGSFELRYSVTGCEFTGDARWPALSERLAERWAESLSGERRVEAECLVDGEPLPVG